MTTNPTPDDRVMVQVRVPRHLNDDLMALAKERGISKNALLLDPSDLDSKYNLEVTLKRLAQRPSQQQQGSGGPGDQAQSPGQQGPAQNGQPGQQWPS